MSKSNDHAKAHRAYHTYRQYPDAIPSALQALKARLDRYELAAKAPEPEPDIRVTDFGTVWSFRPLTAAGRDFIDELETESWQFFGGALHCDHRPARDLLGHLLDSGLSAAVR